MAEQWYKRRQDASTALFGSLSALDDLFKTLDIQLGRLLRIAITEMDIEPVVGKPAKDRKFLIERIEALERQIEELEG